MCNMNIRSVLWLILLISAGAVLAAKPEKKEIVVENMIVGPGHCYLSDHIIPAYGRIINNGPDGASVKVRITASPGSRMNCRQFYSTTLDIPPQCFLNYQSFVALYGTEKYTMEVFDSRRRPVCKEEFFTKPYGKGMRFVLVIDQYKSVFESLLTDSIHGINDDVRVLRPVVRGELAWRWWELEAFDIIILGDMEAENLLPDQARALKDWVRAGGFLIVSPCRDSTSPNPLLQDMLPADITGRRKIILKDFTALSRFTKTRLSNRTQRLNTLELYPRAGSKRLLGTAEHPIALLRRMGLGRIVQMNFDIGDPLLAKAARFHSNIIGFLRSQHTQVMPVNDSRLPATVPAIISSISGVQVLPRHIAGAVILAIIVCSILVIVFFRIVRRHMTAWALLVIFSPAAAFAIFMAGNAWRGEQKAGQNSINLIRVSPDGAVQSQSFCGILGPDPMDLEMSRPAGVIRDVVQESARQLTNTEITDTGNPNPLTACKLNKWELRLFASRSLSRVPDPPTCTLTLNNGATVVTAVNPLDMELEDAVILWNGLARPLGDIHARETRTFSINKSLPLGIPARLSSRDLRSAEDTIRQQILRSLLDGRMFKDLRIRRPVLVGWSDTNPWDIQSNLSDPLNRNVSLVIIEARTIPPSGDIFLPKGMCAIRSVSKNLGAVYRSGKWRAASMPGQHHLRLVCPSEFRNITPETIRVYTRVHGLKYTFTAEIYNYVKKKFESIALNSIHTINTNAPSYFNRSKGCIEIRLTAASEVSMQNITLSTWKIDDLGVDIRGTANTK